MNRKPGTRVWVWIAYQVGMALLFILFGRVGMMLALDHSYVTVIWPPSGVSLVAILAFGNRMIWGIAAGSFFLNLSLGLSPGLSLGIALSDCLEYYGSAFLLRRVARFDMSLSRKKDVFSLILISAVIATMFSAFPGLALLYGSKLVAWHALPWFFLKWWIAGMLGVLVVAPILLVLLKHPVPRLTRPSILEAWTLVFMLLCLLFIIFDYPTTSGQGYYPAALAVFPFVIWAALRYGMWGVSILNPLVALVAIWGTKNGLGPFAGGTPIDNLIFLCLFINAMSIVGLLLAAMSAEQKQATMELEKSHLELEQRVLERTEELAQMNQNLKREMVERKHLEGVLLEANEKHQREFGMELHDNLGQHLTGIAFHGATLSAQLEKQGNPEIDISKRIVKSLNKAINMVRAYSHSLYPPDLEGEGLISALKNLSDNVCELYAIDCSFVAKSFIDIDNSFLEINLYRIAQEAVTNAIKHANAKRIEITLDRHDQGYKLVISDDGKGFSSEIVENNDTGKGMGLKNISYRANVLGADLDIESQSGAGTTISVFC